MSNKAVSKRTVQTMSEHVLHQRQSELIYEAKALENRSRTNDTTTIAMEELCKEFDILGDELLYRKSL